MNSKAHGWASYIDVSDIPETRMQEVTHALDNIWNSAAGRKLVEDAYKSNLNQPIVIAHGHMSYTDRQGNLHELNIPPRQLNIPGKCEITMDFSNMRFEHEGKEVPMTVEHLLRHELHHVAYEYDDLHKGMKDHFYTHVREHGGLKSADFDKLGELGVLKADEIKAYKDRLEKGEQIGLAAIDSKHTLNRDQFEKFTEHLLSSDTGAIRSLVGNLRVSPVMIHSLVAGGTDTQIGVMTVQEGRGYLERIQRGETLTLNTIEQETGRQISFAPLVQYFAMHGIVAMQLSDPQQEQLLRHVENLHPLITAWNETQKAHEEATVKYVDDTTEGPDRKTYGNSISEGFGKAEPGPPGLIPGKGG